MDHPQNNTAIVVGAGRDPGKAIALELAKADTSLTLVVCDEDKDPNVRKSLPEKDKKILLFTEKKAVQSVEEITKRTYEIFGRLDILIISSSFFRKSPIEKVAEEEWDRVIEENLTSYFRWTHAAVPYLLRQKNGRIINVCSSIAFSGLANASHSAASIGGIIGFAKALALELSPYGVTVNTICPGFGVNDLDFYGESNEASRIQNIPLGRLGSPEDIVGTIFYLLSDAARFITGQSLFVNGGLLMK
jgi:3-oxoacyl-[acyl-carrier protein] reductase